MQNMQNYQKMMMMYGNMNKPRFYDPRRMNKQSKTALVRENFRDARIGFYKRITKYDSKPIPYSDDCDPGKANHICEVKVVHDHALDVAEQFSEVGATGFTKGNKMNPLILNVVGKDFDGNDFASTEDLRDELINMRTSFCSNPIKPNIFPIKNQYCVYTPYVIVMRNRDLTPKTWENCYRINLISTSPLIPENGELIRKFSSKEFSETLAIIENVFQAAILESHHCLILTPFGHEADNNPVDDIIKIYNFCIMRYGHKFKSIVVAIPSHYNKEIYLKYLNEIVKPNEIVQVIDDKYDGIQMHKKLKEKMKEDNNSDEQGETETSSHDINNSAGSNSEISPRQMMAFMQMMKQNPAMFNQLAQMANER